MKQPWANRITRYSEESPDQLLAHPMNARIHPLSQAEALKGVLTEVGIVQNVIVNELTNHVLDGHLRISLALRDRQPTVPVTWVRISEDEEKLILATLDPLSAAAAWDKEKLDDLLRDVSMGDAAVQTLLDNLAQEVGVIPPLDAIKDDDLRGRAPEERMMAYINGAIKQIVLYFSQEQYVDVTARLEAICKEHGFDNNTEAFLLLLDRYEEYTNVLPE